MRPLEGCNQDTYSGGKISGKFLSHSLVLWLHGVVLIMAPVMSHKTAELTMSGQSLLHFLTSFVIPLPHVYIQSVIVALLQ